MNKYIFTFGSSQLYAGFYQPIYAKDSITARIKMVEMYGTKWGFQYTEEDWEKTISDKTVFGNWEQPLEAVYCEDV